jgi:hypothetical protein
MCEKCDELQKKIDHFERFLAPPIDPLTRQRINSGIAEMKKQKAAMHPEDTQQPYPRSMVGYAPLPGGLDVVRPGLARWPQRRHS